MASIADLGSWVARARTGDPRAVGRLITLIEDGAPQVRQLMALVATGGQHAEDGHAGEHAGNGHADPAGAHVVGLTGAPGVGKSTTTSALVGALREQGRRVGVLAVDPSSPFSGGALLGDRIRMQEHATDPEVYIRSMASRGHLGGLAAATPQAIRILTLAGCDPVLVETVGVGQSEVEVAGAADTTVVMLAPGMGDGIQAAKAGILEIGDVFVVNKADREGAQATMRELRHMISLGSVPPGGWRPPIVKTVASQGEGIAELTVALGEHRTWLGESGQVAVRRRLRARREIEGIALGTMLARVSVGGPGLLAELAESVAQGDLDPFTAAEELIAGLHP